MDATTPTEQAGPQTTMVEGQLAFYGIDDPQWMPLLLRCLAEGGCILIERTGDLLILPAGGG